MASSNIQPTVANLPVSQSISASFGGPQGGYTPGSSTMYLKERRTPSKLIIVLTYEVWQFIWDFFDLSKVYKERTVYVGGIKKTLPAQTQKEIWQGPPSDWGKTSEEEVPTQYLSVFEAHMLNGVKKGGVKRWKNQPAQIADLLDRGSPRLGGIPVCRITLVNNKIDCNLLGHSISSLQVKRLLLEAALPFDFVISRRAYYEIPETLPDALFD